MQYIITFDSVMVNDFLAFTIALIMEEDDCDNNMAEDGDGGKLHINMLFNVIL